MAQSINEILRKNTIDLIALNSLVEERPANAEAVSSNANETKYWVEPKVDFWGRRTLVLWTKDYLNRTPARTDVVLGTIEAVDLNALIKKVSESQDTQLSDLAKTASKALATKLNKFYTISEDKLKDSGLFARILSWVREWSFFTETTRSRLERLSKSYG